MHRFGLHVSCKVGCLLVVLLCCSNVRICDVRMASTRPSFNASGFWRVSICFPNQIIYATSSTSSSTISSCLYLNSAIIILSFSFDFSIISSHAAVYLHHSHDFSIIGLIPYLSTRFADDSSRSKRLALCLIGFWWLGIHSEVASGKPCHFRHLQIGTVLPV